MAAHDQPDALDDYEDDREELHHALEALHVVTISLVDLDEARVGEQSDDHGGGNDGRNAQLHEGAPV